LEHLFYLDNDVKKYRFVMCVKIFKLTVGTRMGVQIGRETMAVQASRKWCSGTKEWNKGSRSDERR